MGIKNIIMISIDALRFDCVGYQKDKRFLERYGVKDILNTPTLDSIAQKGLCFTQAVSTSTYTTNAHASILTGLYPPRYGVRSFYKTRLARGVKTLAEMLKPAGFRSVLLSDVPELFVPVGLSAGFERVFPDSYETSSNKDRELFDYIQSIRGEKVFLFAHFFDVHEPYYFSETPMDEGYNREYYDLMGYFFKTLEIEPPSNMEDPYIVFRELIKGLEKKQLDATEVLLEPYVRGVNKFDAGRFKFFMEKLKEVGLLDDSLLVIFADHGEGKFIHGFGHNSAPTEGVVRVPLILSSDIFTPGVKDEHVSHVDLVPTIIDIIERHNNVRLDPGCELDGRSVLCNGNDGRELYAEVWTQNKIPDARTIYKKFEFLKQLDIEAKIGWRMLRTPEMKFVLTGEPENFHAKEFMELEGAEFVKQLYTLVLGREPDREGFENNMKFLRNGGNKRELIRIFLGSVEKRQKPLFAMYDLAKDPFEEHPLNPFKDPLNSHLFLSALCKIMAISGRTTKAEDVFSGTKTPHNNGAGRDSIGFAGSDEEQKVMDRLRDLGYME